MASICYRCALRLQRASQSSTQHLSTRTFSNTSTKQRGALPTFTESSNPELNDVLASLHDKHLIPAYLQPHERCLIFGDKHREQLLDSPQTAQIGTKEIPLQWIDRRSEIPNRSKLIIKALNLMIDSQGKDWQNLPALLQGLKEGLKKPLSEERMEKIVRKALQNGKLAVVIQCLQQAHRTGMTLKNDAVLRSVLFGLRDMAQESAWSQSALKRALRDANVVSSMLESEEHGSGSKLRSHDPRMKPKVLGVYLELAAVYSYKHTDATDTEGLVKAYAGRLLSQLEVRNVQPRGKLVLFEKGKQWSMLQAIPIYHGVTVAQDILGKDMPNANVATTVIADYGSALSELAAVLEARNPQDSTYDEQALGAWKACIRH